MEIVNTLEPIVQIVTVVTTFVFGTLAMNYRAKWANLKVLIKAISDAIDDDTITADEVNGMIKAVKDLL